MASTSDDNRAALLERLQELEEENAKLRDVEDQFWILLREREEMQALLRDRTTAGSNSSGGGAADSLGMNSASTAAQRSGSKAAAGHDKDQGTPSVEKLEAALHECLDLLIARDRGETQFASRGPVAAFLSWCEIEQSRLDYQTIVTDHDAAAAKGSSREGKGAQKAASTHPAMSSPEERESFLLRIRQLENEQRQLQDELDRADVSRLQALEDADRLHQHVAVLSEKLIAMRDAATKEKLRADQYASSHSALLTARAQLAERDSEIAKLKAEVEHLRRIDSVGGAELAADAARIRAELAERRAGQR